jgi:hypothetical protein
MRTLTLLCVLLAGCSKKAPPADGFDPAIDGCKADADCTLLHEDRCCEVTPCDEDALAETAARTRQRHETCARKDCVAGKHECSAKDVRFVAACVEGRCVVTRGK